MSGITVSGRGEASDAPDTLSVSIGVSVHRGKVSDATATAAERTERVIAALQARGIADGDLTTTKFSIGPQWDHRGEESRITGYRVDNTLDVTIRDVSAAGDVMDAAIAAGGDEVRIDSVSFSFDDDSALAEMARAAAWGDAAAKASQLAELAGVTLGAPTSIDESTGHGPAPVLRAAAIERTTTPIVTGEHTVTVHLTVTFAIET